MNRPSFLFLTGERGAGKTTLCERLAGEARARGVPAGGVVCPGIFGPDGAKLGCRARDVRTGEEWELGSRDRGLGGPRWKGWSFSAEGFRRANRAISEALALPAGGLVFLDEVGPVELKLRGGLEPSLGSLDRLISRSEPPAFRTVLVVRPELLPLLEARYPGAVVARIEPGDREGALERARGLVFG